MLSVPASLVPGCRNVFSIDDTRLKLPRPAINTSIATMRLLRSLIPSLLLVGAGVVQAASSWSFEDSTLSISSSQGKGASKPYNEKYAHELQF
jgi:hypothetical protein